MARGATSVIAEILMLAFCSSALLMLFAGLSRNERPPAGVRTAIEQVDKRWTKRIQRAVLGNVITSPAL